MKPSTKTLFLGLALVTVGVGSFFLGQHYSSERNIDLGQAGMRTQVAVKVNQVSEAISVLSMLDRGDIASARRSLEVQLTSGLPVLQSLAEYADGTDALLVKDTLARGAAYAREHNLKVIGPAS